MKLPIVILISSAGSRAVESMIPCLLPVRGQIRLVGSNSQAAFASLPDLDAAYLVPATADAAAFSSRMLAIIDIERPDIVINGRDEEVHLLSTLARQAGVLFLGPPPALTELFDDKYETWRYCARHGLPFARTARSAPELDQLASQCGFPLIAKPRRGGYASKDVYLVDSWQQASARLAAGNAVFQSIVGQPAGAGVEREAVGVPYSKNPTAIHHMLDFVIGERGELISACISRAEGTGSHFHRLELLDDPALRVLLERHAALLGAAGHRGPVNIQGGLERDGQFCAFEWNARFVGSVDGFALLGVNLVLDALRHFFPQLTPCAGTASVAGVLFRPTRYRAVPAAAIRQLEVEGCWLAAGTHRHAAAIMAG